MHRKTHRTAVVAIPPDELWEPIQAIRRRYDPQTPRWMPHITLLYPFWVEEALDEAARLLADVCTALTPFEATLARFGEFRHRQFSTLWLAPDPRDAFIQLQAALAAPFPKCTEQSAFRSGFYPHLSVGRFASVDELLTIRDQLQKAWQPLVFSLDTVALIRRETHGPFAVVRHFRLGKASACGTGPAPFEPSPCRDTEEGQRG